MESFMQLRMRFHEGLRVGRVRRSRLFVTFAKLGKQGAGREVLHCKSLAVIQVRLRFCVAQIYYVADMRVTLRVLQKHRVRNFAKTLVMNSGLHDCRVGLKKSAEYLGSQPLNLDPKANLKGLNRLANG